MYVRLQSSPDLPPPLSDIGVIGWMKRNLFYSKFSSVLTVLLLIAVFYIVAAIFDWAVIKGVVWGDRDACQASNEGACWAFIVQNFNLFIYGFYDLDQRWRIDIALVLFFVGLFWMMYPRMPARKWVSLFMLLVYPLIAIWLLAGGFGLVPVSSRSWGGFALTLLVAVTGIVFSLPLGVLLALGRRSSLPAIKVVSVTLIEFCRGVPFITVLFMSAYLLPFFLPVDSGLNQLSRALIGVVIFSGAYMAEVIRGGLQALPKGQVEAAQALGLNYFYTQYFIVLPQAIKMVIPSIVNSNVALFKDTTLVAIISLADFLGTVHTASRSSSWLAANVPITSFVFMAAVFWLFCWGMSRYSRNLEDKLNRGNR